MLTDRTEIYVVCPPGRRLGGLAPFLLLAVLVVLCALVAANGLLEGGTTPVRTAATHLVLPGPGAPGAAGVAAAYQYPLACLTVTIAASEPAYASARLDRASPCWRIGAYGVELLRRVNGTWHALATVSGLRCRPLPIPHAVAAQLGVC